MKSALPILLLLALEAMGAPNPLRVDLSGDWHQSPDDQPHYASPAFDDRTWPVTRLPYTASRERSSATYWLRKTIELPPDVDRSNAVLTIGPVREVYEVYWNGERIGTTGPFLDDSQAQIARTRIFPIPAAAMEGRARVSLALRTRGVYFGSISSFIYLGGSYLLSDASLAPAWEAQAMTDRQALVYAPRLVSSGLLLLLALLTFGVWLAERERRELMWIAALTGCRGVNDAVMLGQLSLTAMPGGPLGGTLFLASVAGMLIAILELALATVAWRAIWLRVPLWIMVAATQLAAPLGFAALCADLAVLLILAVGWWLGRLRQPPTRMLTAAVIALLAAVQIQALGGLRILGLAAGWFPIFYSAWSMQVSLQSTIFIVLGGILLLLSLGRLIGDRIEKQRLGGELEAARGLQSLLLSGSQPGIDAVYLPASEVGGDFWHVYGGQLLVAGDVSGKGLKAAMVVSLVTGMLDRRHADSPAALLAELNEALCARLDGGFVTCCVVRWSHDGQLTAANAGHPAPYLNGQELDLPPGLPLGVVPGAEYDERTLPFEGSLTLVSDGVIEAENVQRELFGFARTREISTQSAREIAEAAKAWGQNDDITVVSLTRNS